MNHSPGLGYSGWLASIQVDWVSAVPIVSFAPKVFRSLTEYAELLSDGDCRVHFSCHHSYGACSSRAIQRSLESILGPGPKLRGAKSSLRLFGFGPRIGGG